MPTQLIELAATYLEERFRFANADGDTIIGRAWLNGSECKEIAVKGQADIDELRPEQDYRFYGKWVSYKNKRTGQEEQQFAFQSFVVQQPHSRSGVITYLKAAGEGFGFGTARATKLWDWYGSEAVQAMRERPAEVADRLAGAGLKLSAENAAAIAKVLVEEATVEGCTLDLMDLLTGRGFPKGTSRLAVREWGNRAAQIIRRNPYRLMNFRGCGFKKTDALYLDLGLPPSRLKRQALCAWYAIARDTEGHTWFPASFAESGIRGNVGGAELKIPEALELATRAKWLGELHTETATGPLIPAEQSAIRWLAEGKKSRHEADLAQAICDGLKEPCLWPDVSAIAGVTDHQREQLANALRGPIAILGGSPGTGKTYSAAVLIKLLVSQWGVESIGIGAPTGKAAVRVTEALAGYGLPLRAKTWHSMLALLERWGVKHFPYKVLVGDETSMNDTDLTAAVFRARAAGTQVLLVGDINQLPPVGHGAPLRDMIAAGLPYGELREIMRSSGGIVEACASIRDGQPWQPGDNLRLVDSHTAERQIAAMILEIKQAAAAGRDPIWNCQVVVPVNAKSALARKELNKVLQNELNPTPGIEGSPFRVRDKIVNTKNGYFPSVDFDSSDEETQVNDRGEVYVANGELAEVLKVEPKLTIAKLANPARTIKIPRGKAVEAETDDDQQTDDKAPATGCSWDLGYALSVHKSQGSEWPVVIVMIDDYPGAKMVCSREWIYTGISRAKELCVLIGKKTVADGFCRRIALGKRKTFLKERILLAKANDELAEL